jgi:putative oxidoreductase
MTHGTTIPTRTAPATNVDLGLLVLRIWLGMSLAMLHGWGKAAMLLDGEREFPSVLGLPPTLGLTLAVIGEVVAAVLVALGIATRIAALYLTGMFTIVFFVVHGGALSGENSGELAFIFLGGFVTLFITGGGRYALGDRLLPSTDVSHLDRR